MKLIVLKSLTVSFEKDISSCDGKAKRKQQSLIVQMKPVNLHQEYFDFHIIIFMFFTVHISLYTDRGSFFHIQVRVRHSSSSAARLCYIMNPAISQKATTVRQPLPWNY